MKKVIIFLVVFLIVSGVIYLFPKNSNLVENNERNSVFQYVRQEKSIKEKNIKNESEKILFVGDMMFDRAVKKKINNLGFESIFLDIENIFHDSDFVVGNLEGTITTNKSIAIENNEILRFTFSPDIALFLKKTGFDLLSLANNHSFDFGEEGYQSTVGFLNSSSINNFGSYRNDKNLSKEIFLNDKKYCFVGYHDLYNYDSESVIVEIKKMKNSCYKTIVMPHWGEEYLNNFTKRQQDLAYSFIDSGADLIIGTHPHVIEPIEVYKNKAIFYSIGNFVFDQYFSFETSHGLVVKVLFDNEKTTFELIPVNIDLGVVTFPEEKNIDKIFEPIYKSNISLDKINSIKTNKSFIVFE